MTRDTQLLAQRRAREMLAEQLATPCDFDGPMLPLVLARYTEQREQRLGLGITEGVIATVERIVEEHGAPPEGAVIKRAFDSLLEFGSNVDLRSGEIFVADAIAEAAALLLLGLFESQRPGVLRRMLDERAAKPELVAGVIVTGMEGGAFFDHYSESYDPDAKAAQEAAAAAITKAGQQP
jgi:hypothetical protein